MLEMPSARTLLAQMRPLRERERSRFSSPSVLTPDRPARAFIIVKYLNRDERARAHYREADQSLIRCIYEETRELLESVL